MFDLEIPSQRDSRLYHGFTSLGYGVINAPETWVYLEPNHHSPRQSQYTYGEPVRILQQLGTFLYTQSLRDDYCGWVSQSALSLQTNPPHTATHRTIAIAPVTQKANLKSPIITVLPQDSWLSPDEWQDGYAYVSGLGWLDGRHLEALDTVSSIEQSALEQLGRSYVWGGRGLAGLDCSALAQWCYLRAGYLIPRDSDLQALYLKTHHKSISLDTLQAGDLLFTKGHVMVAYSNQEIIHASGHHMKVVREHLEEASKRMQTQQGNAFYLHAYRW
ncbi:MAG: NlpC/P60 family protein [Cardiobacteriaceae bacterium]|nr:NlpC/P60 family protein [Cardiobacteriaceae bacterium]